MTIAVDWDVKHQTKQTYHSYLDKWYHAWLASTWLLQRHDFMPELKIYDIFRFWGQWGDWVGTIRASAGGMYASQGTCLVFHTFVVNC